MHESPSHENIDEIVDLALVAGNDANLKFPLNFVAIGPAIAEQLLQVRNMDWKQFAITELNSSQVDRLRSAMEKAHKAFDIDYTPDDKRLKELWNQYKRNTLITIARLWNILNPLLKVNIPSLVVGFSPPGDMGELVNRMLKSDPAMTDEIRKLANAMVSTLTSEEGKEITEEHRNAIAKKFQEVGFNSMQVQAAGSLTHKAMEVLMVKALVAVLPRHKRLIYDAFGF